jgi:hypothetical protein
MERGLLWLPLLGMFIWLAWAGWREYRKVEAYQTWAQDFERHKYDIYAVLGQKGDRLTWGKPTLKEPDDLQTIALQDIQAVRLKLDAKVITGQDFDLNNLPSKAKIIAIELITPDEIVFSIPFTEVAIAANWFRYLSRLIAMA